MDYHDVIQKIAFVSHEFLSQIENKGPGSNLIRVG